MTVLDLAAARTRRMRRCATRGHRLGPDGKGTCPDCGLTVR